MDGRWIRGTLTALVAAAVALAAAAGAPSPQRVSASAAPIGTPRSYVDGPPPGHTGGFGEPTCHACHFGSPPNEAPGKLSLRGLPATLPAGADTVPLTVVLTRPGMGRAGFQLAARFASGPRRGEQAGRLLPDGHRTERVEAGGVEFVQHTEAGSRLPAPDTARWTLLWAAPPGDDAVLFHLSANAADDDASEFGDRIYADSVRVGDP